MSNPQDDVKVSIFSIIIWSVGALFFLYEFFLRTFIGTLGHQIIPALHLTPTRFAEIGAAYYVAYGVLQVPVGIILDRFGIKLVMTLAACLCGVATFLFAHSQDFILAFLARALMGVGSAFAFVSLLMIVATWFPRKNFAMMAGMSQFVGTMGPMLAGGPLVAAMHSFHSTWRVTLSVIALFGVFLGVLIFFVVKTKPRSADNIIWLTPSKSIWKEVKGLLTNKQAWLIAGYSVGVYVSIELLGAVWGTEYLQVRGLSQGMAASMISTAWLGYAIGCPLVGAISDYMHRRKPLLILCALIGVLSTTLIVYLPVINQIVYFGAFFLLGVAASGQNVGFAAIAEQVDESTKAAALGLNNGAMILSAAIVPMMVGEIVSLLSGPHVTHFQPHVFVIALSVMPVLMLMAVILAILFVKETYCKPQKAMLFLDVS